MHIKFSKIVFTEIGFIFLLWLISVLISSQVFIINRPLTGFFEGIITHTLVSMRGFEEWGFWKLLGTSTLLPKSYEFIGINLTTLIKPEIYLSYPSLWLVLPYIGFKLLNLLPVDISISPQYLQIYNLLFTRLLCAVVIYYLYLEIIKILSQGFLTGYQQRLIAMLGLAGWIFTPPVLYWTQNVHLPDLAVLLPVYTLFLIALKCRFNFERLSNLTKVLLFISALLATGSDWYGWVSIAVILLLKLINDLLEKRTSLHVIGFLKKYLNSVKPILLGIILSGLAFIVQILYFKDGIRQLLEIAAVRSNALKTDSGVPLTLFGMLRGIVMHWSSYLPPALQPFLVRLIHPTENNNIGIDPLVNRVINDAQQLSFINAFLSMSVVFILLLFSLLYLYKKSKNNRFILYVYALVFLVPLLQILLLKQHSYMHCFSAFKMGLPISFSLLVLPILTLISILKSHSINKSFNSRNTNIALSSFIALLVIIIMASSGDGLRQFASVSLTPSREQELGVLVSRNIKATELPVTDVPKLVVGPYPPTSVWYGTRYVYNYKELSSLRQRANSSHLKRMQPVFLTYKNISSASIVNPVCQGKWINFVEKVEGFEIVACKATELSQVLD